MNLYFLVEGRRTEKRVYRAWIGHVFPELQEVDRIEDVSSNNFYLLSGNGYPSYRSRVIAALDDITKYGGFDEFTVCVDAEQVTVAEKMAEISALFSEGSYFEKTHIVVHNCCIETWFLGYTKMLRRYPHSQILRAFKTFYDVSLNDPEEMAHPPKFETRAQFHVQYLKEMLRERGLSYTKSRPSVVREKDYLAALVERYSNTGHINTFGNLIALWRSWGGSI